MLLNEESGGHSSEAESKELDLAKAVDAMESRLEKDLDSESKVQKWQAYEQEYREKFSTDETQSKGENTHEEDHDLSSTGHAHMDPVTGFGEKPVEDRKMLSYPRKLSVLYVLLSACLADTPEDDSNKSTQQIKGYDARYRVALRLLATWFDVKWIKMVCSRIQCLDVHFLTR